MARENARRLRKEMTDAERHLWESLRHRQVAGAKFRRQALIGPFIADFVSFDARVIVELDGGQHASQEDADERRTAWLNGRGFLVLRFWNHDVLQDRDVVLQVIYQAVRERLRSTPKG